MDSSSPRRRSPGLGGWRENNDQVTDAGEYARVIAKLPLRSEPGRPGTIRARPTFWARWSRWPAGKPLDVLVKERVTGPLGMTDTGFSQPESQRKRFAEPLKERSDRLLRTMPRKPSLLSGGGGISSTAEDYLRFVLMLEGDGQYKGERILKPETLARMRQDETTPEIQKAGLFFPGPGMGFGLGFSLVKGPPQLAGRRDLLLVGIAGTEFWVDPKNERLHGSSWCRPASCHGLPAQEPAPGYYDALVK